MGRLDDALRDAERALKLHPNDVRALTVRGYVSLHRGDLDRALRDFQAGFDGSYPPAVLGYAEALVQAGKGDSALSAFDRLGKIAASDWQRRLVAVRQAELNTLRSPKREEHKENTKPY